METKTNAYGNLLIVYDATKDVPEFKNNDKNHIVIINAPADFMHEHLKFFIARTKTYGNIFGNLFAYNNFPKIKDEESQGACSVVFARRGLETYAVLVQGKDKKFIMNPAGFMSVHDKTLEDCAKRELMEETPLKVPENCKWQPIASWKFKMNFAGLAFIGFTMCGLYLLDEMPLHWIPRGDVTVFPSEERNDEIQSVILLNIKALPNYKALNAAEKFPTSFGGHHFNLVLKAAIHHKLLGAQYADLEEPVPYLLAFAFDI